CAARRAQFVRAAGKPPARVARRRAVGRLLPSGSLRRARQEPRSDRQLLARAARRSALRYEPGGVRSGAGRGDRRHLPGVDRQGM
ncbi:MAG: Fructose-bisphosphate aldolase class I, partial [uncultured Sphingomonadaceae bacterium]